MYETAFLFKVLRTIMQRTVLKLVVNSKRRLPVENFMYETSLAVFFTESNSRDS